MGTLEHGAHGYGELLAAALLAALVQALTVGFALKLVVAADHATVRADRTIGPADRLKIFAGSVIIVEVRGVERGRRHCEILLLVAIVSCLFWFVKGIIAKGDRKSTRL